jgi:hypothetical protein
MRSHEPHYFAVLAFFLCTFASLSQVGQQPEDTRGLNGLQEVALSQLSDSRISPLGKAALSIQPGLWKHAETENFVYHFFHGFIATPVSLEAEFYYRVIAKELGKDTQQWERKSHIYIFEDPGDWTTFQEKASLEPWTGGIHSGDDLFIQRNPEYKFKGRTLGHEVTHLVIHRFFGNGVPLWLNEGCAEYASILGYASFNRARGMNSKPMSQIVVPEDYIPLEKLANTLSYPDDFKQVTAFYTESERLVHFLNSLGSQNFVQFLDAMSKGNKFETALSKAYGNRFQGLNDLELEFKPYATGNSPAK